MTRTHRANPVTREPEPQPEASHFFNRDLSWLEFNRRVLAQAADADFPLLERVKFLAIFSNNLDEFFMKRIGQLKRSVLAGIDAPGPDGLRGRQVLAALCERVIELQRTQADLWERTLRPALAAEGVHILRYADLDAAERTSIDAWYRANVFPVLTPLAVDPGHRFPFISNLSENLGVLVCAPGSPERHFARIKVPDVLPRFVPVGADAPMQPGDLSKISVSPDAPLRLLPLEELIINNLDDLFPGMETHDVTPFRLTRNAAVEREDDEVEDLLEHVEAELHMRRFASAVRIETGPNPSPGVLAFVTDELGLADEDVYQRPGPLEYADLFQIADLALPHLRFEPWIPVIPPAIAHASSSDSDLFAIVRERDVLLHHPYESFKASVERFIAAAARDPDVLAIKQTIYRTSRDSPFVASLIRAAESGKQVACLVELRARFDEQKNLRFARQLEKHGVHVAYGVVGLKTHCKCSLVVRRESGGLRSYAHLGTGNYNPHTAQLYTDIGLLTSNPRITDDVVALFNLLTGRSQQTDYNELLIAPANLRRQFSELIRRETENARRGLPARIFAKVNSLEDRKMTELIYEASRAGVRVDLVVRGFCCLRPGVAGLSENVRVLSVVGRFLEHSRVFHFANARENPLEGDWYIGSADWMYRNLNNRVEAVIPVRDADARRRLNRIREVMLADRRRAWSLNPDGSYTQHVPPPDAPPDSPAALGTFRTLMNDTLTASDQA